MVLLSVMCESRRPQAHLWLTSVWAIMGYNTPLIAKTALLVEPCALKAYETSEPFFKLNAMECLSFYDSLLAFLHRWIQRSLTGLLWGTRTSSKSSLSGSLPPEQVIEVPFTSEARMADVHREEQVILLLNSERLMRGNWSTGKVLELVIPTILGCGWWDLTRFVLSKHLLQDQSPTQLYMWRGLEKLLVNPKWSTITLQGKAPQLVDRVCCALNTDVVRAHQGSTRPTYNFSRWEDHAQFRGSTMCWMEHKISEFLKLRAQRLCSRLGRWCRRAVLWRCRRGQEQMLYREPAVQLRKTGYHNKQPHDEI